MRSFRTHTSTRQCGIAKTELFWLLTTVMSITIVLVELGFQTVGFWTLNLR